MGINATMGIHCYIGMWWGAIGRHNMLQVNRPSINQWKHDGKFKAFNNI